MGMTAILVMWLTIWTNFSFTFPWRLHMKEVGQIRELAESAL